MSEINPFAQPPVFKTDQVFTFYDIEAVRNGYIYQYQGTSKYNLKRRWMLRVGVGVCNELLHWLAHGKPQNGVKCKGDRHESV